MERGDKMKKSTEADNRSNCKSGQKLLFFSIILCISIFSFSCSSSIKDPLLYKEKAFSARVAVAGGSLNFEAVFNISRAENFFSAELVAPESLKGLTLIQSGNNMKILLEDKEFLSDSSELLRSLDIGKIAEMLAPEGIIRSIKSVGGLTAVSVGDVTVYIDPNSSFPVKAESNEGLSVKVLDLWISSDNS